MLAASHLQQDRHSGIKVVRDLYRAFWVRGKDISNPLVLDECKIYDGTDLEDLIGEWNEGWHATGHTDVPLIVSPDGNQLVGCAPEEQVKRFFDPLAGQEGYSTSGQMVHSANDFLFGTTNSRCRT